MDKFLEALKHGYNVASEGIGAAGRETISELQEGNVASVPEKAIEGFLNPEQARNWEDIAKKTGIENPKALMAIGAVGSLLEPGLPFGKAGKVTNALQKLTKGAKVEQKGANLVKKATASETGKKWLYAALDADGQKAVAEAGNKVLDLGQKLKASKVHKIKEEAKKFAVQAVKEELAQQPALARDPNYLKERINTLANIFFRQNFSK